MTSLTYWSQLQPSPRLNSVAEALAARVRDPVWLMARQWQLGEFEGADAGSPAFVRITSHADRLASVKLGATTVPLASAQLLEPLVEAEPLGPDLATSVEIGQAFEALVNTTVRDLFRGAYAIGPADASTDPATARFLAVCAGRAVDGVALYAAAKKAQQQNQPLPPVPVLDQSLRSAASQAIATFLQWVEATWGAPGSDEPPAWDANRLEYAPTVSAGGLTLGATPDAESTLDWYAFDVIDGAVQPTPSTPPTPSPGATTVSVIPGHVRFRGMPNARWWDFETSKTDFGAILPDPRDLAKLLFADFMLLHGDDWYLAPLDVPTGSLCSIDRLTVTDVFGVVTSISRADADAGPRWTLFSTINRGASGLAPFLVVPSSAAAASIEGDAVEEVHLLRDETADMAWAIEHIVESPIGAARVEPLPPLSAPPSGVPAPWWYELMTPLPPSWFPLLPQQLPSGAVALIAGTVEGGPREPSGRLVRRLSANGFQLPEEEIGRAGIRLQRVACRTRSSDGGMHLWIARRKAIGAGEASSGLRFDRVSASAEQT
jgi:hypothetical protein